MVFRDECAPSKDHISTTCGREGGKDLSMVNEDSEEQAINTRGRTSKYQNSIDILKYVPYFIGKTQQQN